jgi:hypothetical protein
MQIKTNGIANNLPHHSNSWDEFTFQKITLYATKIYVVCMYSAIQIRGMEFSLICLPYHVRLVK